MRIGLVLPSLPKYSETFFTNKINGLKANGYEVVLFLNDGNGIVATPELKIAPNLSGNSFKSFVISFYTIFKMFFFHFYNVKRLYVLNSKDNFSFSKNIKNIIINSHILSERLDWLHFEFGTMVLERENVAEAIKAQMAVSFRGFDHYIYPLKNENCYKTLFAKKVKYQVLSEGMKSTLLLKGIESRNIIKICPAIDTNLFFTSAKNETRNILQVVTISRLHWIKGLDYIFEALAILKKNGIEFKFSIIGDGKDIERYWFAVQQFNIDENVVFLGKLSPLEVQKELENTDLYLQYSLQEGFCNAVLEAQAMGTLCIVSDAEGLTENVVDKITGFIVPKRNALSLANAIQDVFSLSESVKSKVKEEAIKRIKENFNLKNQVRDIIAFYEEKN